MAIGMSATDSTTNHPSTDAVAESLPDGNEVHKAIVDGNLEQLTKLASSNISLEIKNPYGLTPLHLACLRKNRDCVEILIKYVTQTFAQYCFARYFWVLIGTVVM